jgi:hypothetical protein
LGILRRSGWALVYLVGFSFMSRYYWVLGLAIVVGPLGLAQRGFAQTLLDVPQVPIALPEGGAVIVPIAPIEVKPAAVDLVVPPIARPEVVVPDKGGLKDEPPNPKAQSRTSLEKSGEKYPALIDPRGEALPLSANQKGRKLEVDTTRREKRSVIHHGAYSQYKPEEQLYRVLPGNRVVIETQGVEVRLDYQGREYRQTIDEKIQSTQSLWGLQSVWVVPQGLQDLLGQENFGEARILSVSGEAMVPKGEVAPRVLINSPSYTIRPPNLGAGATYSPNGGAVLFSELEAGNTPTLLQAYPTNNLQVFLEGEGLVVGAKTPPSLLKRAGIVFGDPLTGKGFRFQPEITSFPGIKIGQPDKFDNLDLLNVLLNPFLEQSVKDNYYLNSLQWVSLGLKQPKIVETKTRETNQDWYQVRFSKPHNRTVIQYEKQLGLAVYYNVFANPGVSLTVSFDKNAVHRSSSGNATVGALLGGLFEILKPKRIEKSLWEARLRQEREDPFTPLRTETTAEQRRLINQRLNRTLDLAGRVSGIAQLSGSFSSPSHIRPDRSSVFQIRAGLVGRRSRPIQVDQSFEDGDTFISKLRLSNRDFGPLVFVGVPVNPDLVSESVTENRSTAVQVLVADRNGVPRFELQASSDQTVVPVGIRTFTSAFDRIELSQIGNRQTVISRFDGMVYLPTVEVLRSGTRGNFSYGWSGGAWWNASPNVAPNVVRNDFGDVEKNLGLYGNGLLSWSSTKVVQDKNVVRRLTSHSTGVRLAVNSQSNASNPSSLTLSHSMVRQTAGMNLSVTGGLFLAGSRDHGANSGRVISFLRGQVRLPMGLEVNLSVEKGASSLNSLEVSQTVGKGWAVGLYGRNYATVPGPQTREEGKRSMGFVVTHSPKKTMEFRGCVGFEDGRLQLQLQGEVSF